MTESNLVQVDNQTLIKEFNYFRSISDSIGKHDSPLRRVYINELEKVFHSSDKKHDGKIDRQEFETLIKGYFELKGIQPTEENYDQYFNKLDIDHDKVITWHEFVQFVDCVV